MRMPGPGVKVREGQEAIPGMGGRQENRHEAYSERECTVPAFGSLIQWVVNAVRPPGGL